MERQSKAIRNPSDARPDAALVGHHQQLGVQLLNSGQIPDAIAHLRAALRENIADQELHAAYGHAMELANQNDAAADSYARAIALGGPRATLTRQQARAQLNNGAPDLALACLEELDSICPRNQSYRALALLDKGHCAEALALAESACEQRPDALDLIGNLGSIYLRQGALDDALQCFTRITDAEPDNILARYHRSLVHLTRGDYQLAWPDFDAHIQLWGRPFPRSGDLHNAESTLLHCQNGLGDTLQFIRYTQRLSNRRQRVTVIAQDRLLPLLKHSLPDCTVQNSQAELPPFDSACSVIELPALFNDSIQSIPTEMPYLKPRTQDVSRWRDIIQRTTQSTDLQVGIAWHGAIDRRNSLYRSCKLVDFAPLATIPGLQFHSLQIGAGADEISERSEGLSIIDYSATLDREAGPFMDTAALLSNLDLVITVDTSIAHLAGALNRPTWLLLPFWSDWRWGRTGSTSAWYPSMRLFRQPEPFDWATVFRDVKHELIHHLKSGNQTNRKG